MEDNVKFSLLCKKLMMSELEECFKKYPNFIITNYLGVSSNDLNRFRQEVEKADSKYLVVKNRFFKRVLDQMGLNEYTDIVDGGCGVTFVGEEFVDPAKLTIDYTKRHEGFTIKGARIDGQRVDAKRLKEIAALPSREVLLSMVVSAIQSPLSGLVGVLGGVTRKFVYTLQAIKKKKGENK